MARTTEIRFTTCPTPYGGMTVASTEQGVCRMMSPGQTLDELYAWTARVFPRAELVPDPDSDHGLSEQLDAYFAGQLRRFDVPIDLRGTPFQLTVWETVRMIPFGETRSYLDVARMIGKPSAPRAVGAANAVTPLCIIVPCHRVIGSDGTLKRYPGGILSRRLLHEIEGIRVREG